MVKSKIDFTGLTLQGAIDASKAEFIRQDEKDILHELFITDTVRALGDKYVLSPMDLHKTRLIMDFEDWCYNHG